MIAPMQSKKYQKRPVVIDAFVWDPTSSEPMPEWTNGLVVPGENSMLVDTLEGPMTAQPGDYIIRGVKGEVYPCEPDIFALTYREAPRVVNGFEVVEGWEMPEPPVKGAIPCVQFHGGDGSERFWWHPDWSIFPNANVSWRELKSFVIPEFEDPLIDPDTGGARWKECQEAYVELGFRIA